MFGNDVNDKSMKVPGGLQRITTEDGFCIPLNIKAGLPYRSMRLYIDNEWDDLPHIILTSDTDWNPSILDNTIDDNEEWFDALSDFPNDTPDSLFDLQGNYRHQHVVHYININSIELENGVLPNNPDCIEVYEGDITPFER